MQPVETHPSRVGQMGRVLSSPLLVTVVAALLGSLLLPQLTRQWQDHQKALEIQTDLVGQMSASVSSAVASARFVAAGLVANASQDPRAEQRAWNDGDREWTTTSASIGAKLQAYFGSRIGSEWRSFSDVVTDFVLLSAAPTPAGGRADQAAEIFRYAPNLPDLRLSRRDWLTLAQTRSGAA